MTLRHYFPQKVNGAMVEGIQLKVTMARRQPSFDQNNDQSTKSWSSIGIVLSLQAFNLQCFVKSLVH